MKLRVNPNSARVSVSAQTAFQEYRASCAGLSGEVSYEPGDLLRASGSFTLDLRRFSSNDRVRDFAVKTHVDLAKHPEAQVSGLKLLDFQPSEDGQKLRWEAVLKYRFKTPKIQGEALLQTSDGRLRIKASFPLALKDVGLDVPKALMMKSETVTVEVSFDAL